MTFELWPPFQQRPLFVGYKSSLCSQGLHYSLYRGLSKKVKLAILNSSRLVPSLSSRGLLRLPCTARSKPRSASSRMKRTSWQKPWRSSRESRTLASCAATTKGPQLLSRSSWKNIWHVFMPFTKELVRYQPKGNVCQKKLIGRISSTMSMKSRNFNVWKQ